ncbi:glycoside hydrolase family 88 protein [Halobellus captivus]|uniref:glycoside hydrolase family 88 protein n=1 Tax=Halobellus captivus TaxID=2592614 RepID=UPI0013969AEF|nr:glycoside hydrolase family 88 protein [Halobellus captivus]
MSKSLEDVVQNVADYTIQRDMESERWEKSVAISGLMATDYHTDVSRQLVDRAIDTQTSDGQFAYGWGDSPGEWARRADYDVEEYNPTTNAAVLATNALDFYEMSGDERYLDAVSRQYDYFETVDRTSDGGISRRDEWVELFTEPLYFLCPFFVRFGLITDSSVPIDEAVKQVDVHTKHLRDDHAGLFRHIWRETPNTYPGGPFWSRGNGWATMGLMETIRALPQDHRARERIVHILEETMDAIIDLQDDSGFWHLILDDSRTSLESSGTLMFVYTLKKGLQEGFLEGTRYEEAASRAMDVCTDVVNEEGAVRRVSKPPASANSPLGTTSYGQGSFLLAASCFLND